MSKPDLSTEIKGIKFRNPVLPGSSDIILDVRGVERCLQQGVGGIVTKSFTPTRFRTRARPYHFNYRVFGKEFSCNFVSKGSVCHLDPETVAEKFMPKAVRLCRDEGVPIIVSILGSENPEEWAIEARRFEDAGADMLEINLSCPHSGYQIGKSTGKTLGSNLELVRAIIKAVKSSVKIPISPKLSAALEPFAHHVKGWVEAGADCITANNTAVGIMIDIDQEVPFGGLGPGGYPMGRSFLPWSLARIVELKEYVDIPIIGVGGIHQAQDAIMYLLLGCPAVQIASAVNKYGYKLFGEIIKGIEKWMEKKNYSSTHDFIGNAYKLASLHSSQDLIEMEWPFVGPEERMSPVIPMVDFDKCVFCGKCQDFCLSEVFSVDKKRKKLKMHLEERCWGCGDCVGWCPSNAIKMIDQETKEVVWENKGLAKPYRPENWKRKA
jgi:dihydroorotate dehydrogenase subfamily 1